MQQSSSPVFICDSITRIVVVREMNARCIKGEVDMNAMLVDTDPVFCEWCEDLSTKCKTDPNRSIPKS